ncbi:unnamed protein product [Didymodactylos carnosus]|uniref:Hexosyltransferase n=1 Tax=Didymodactylos carnosus TaxID=1234261 RepID=A0A815WLH7_9BILA|nr:unnamed protein product [Didymodactylos carnosus]CAF1547496.1 unnamed protein product [Didymodactylos carnosus]CAF4117549.1 unnamed protein product [Didymodactylos carnosus]CAF4408299.1 unnamed protein product [Didymodactylos carnosus]
MHDLLHILHRFEFSQHDNISSNIFSTVLTTTSKSTLLNTIIPERYVQVSFNEHSYANMCRSDDILLVYILSTIQNLERRHYIRQTYANRTNHPLLNHTCFVFLVGLQSSGDPVLKQKVKLEREKYNDIVQIQHNESYQNVVFKEVGALKWSFEYHSQIPYLFKTDDDLITDTILLSAIVNLFLYNKSNSDYLNKQLNSFVSSLDKINKQTFFRGSDMGGQPTQRNTGKYGVNELTWNFEVLPQYCSGFGFLMAKFIRDRLYRASLHYLLDNVAWVGDVFVSGFLAGAAAVRCSGWQLDYAQVADGCTEHFKKANMLVCSTPMHSSIDKFCEYGKIWEIILQRHSSSDSKFIQKTNNSISSLLPPHLNCNEAFRL